MTSPNRLLLAGLLIVLFLPGAAVSAEPESPKQDTHLRKTLPFTRGDKADERIFRTSDEPATVSVLEAPLLDVLHQLSIEHDIEVVACKTP